MKPMIDKNNRPLNPGKPPVNRQILDGTPRNWQHPAAGPKTTNIRHPQKGGK
jgi:hypothetical protein